MIRAEYLHEVRADLLGRVQAGTILINDSVSTPVQTAVISSHPVTGIQNAIALQVTAPQVKSVPIITNVKLITEAGMVVAEKSLQLSSAGAQFLTLTFVVDVKGGQ